MKQILNNKHMWMVFKLFGVFNQLLLLDSQINEWTSINVWFVWNKSNKSHSSYISTSVFQPGFRGTSRFREWLPGVPPKHRNKQWCHISIHLLYYKSRIDTWINAKVSMSNANICGRFRCSERFKNTHLNWSLSRRKVKNWHQMPTWHFIYFQRGNFAYLRVKLFHWIRIKHFTSFWNFHQN